MFGFKRRPLAADNAVRLAQEGRLVLVDVRTPTEIEKTGRASGAINIPFGDVGVRADPEAPRFDQRLTEGDTIAVYCASGIRSAKAVAAMKEFGLKNVYDIGRLKDWTDAGGGLER